MSPEALVAGGIILLVGNGGVAWLGMKYGMNGLREDVSEIKEDVKTIRDNQVKIRERLTKLEAFNARQ